MNEENTESKPPSDEPSVRHNRPVDKAAAALAEKAALPAPPAKQLNWEQMQEYFALLTPEMWSHVMVYLYRIKPRIIRQLKDPDAPNYIDCVSEPFNLDYIINRHGGGKYMVECTDSARKSANLFRCHFVVDEVRYEPKLNYEELDINNRENMSYIQMLQHRGTLDSKGHPVTNPQATAQTAGGVNTEVIKEILGFVSKMSAEQQEKLVARLSPDKDSIGKSVGDILVEQMRQNDPNKQTESIVKLISAIQAMYGQNKAADTTGVYAPFIQMLSEQNKVLVSLIEKIGRQRDTPAPPAPPNDDLDRLDKIMNIAERLRGGGGGRRGPWDIGLDYAREIGVPLISQIGNWIGMRRGVGPMPMPPAGAAANGTAPPMGAFDPYANPAAARAYAASLAGQQPAPNPAPPASNPTPAGNDLLTLLQSYSGMVLNALNNNVPGYDFADNIVRLVGAVPHAMICNYGEDNIVQNMLLVPEVGMFGEGRLRRFCNEFIHYEEIIAKEESEVEAEA